MVINWMNFWNVPQISAYDICFILNYNFWYEKNKLYLKFEKRGPFLVNHAQMFTRFTKKGPSHGFKV